MSTDTREYRVTIHFDGNFTAGVQAHSTGEARVLAGRLWEAALDGNGDFHYYETDTEVELSEDGDDEDGVD